MHHHQSNESVYKTIRVFTRSGYVLIRTLSAITQKLTEEIAAVYVYGLHQVVPQTNHPTSVSTHIQSSR
jgi:hypothetical protein